MEKNTAINWVHYSQRRNEHAQSVVKTKNSYYDRKVAECKHDMKKLWQVLKELYNPNRLKSNTSIEFKISIIYDKERIAETQPEADKHAAPPAKQGRGRPPMKMRLDSEEFDFTIDF